MKKEEILSLWNTQCWRIEKNIQTGDEFWTSIPHSEKDKWEFVIFCEFTEEEVCELLDRDFAMQLKEKLPDLIKQALDFLEDYDEGEWQCNCTEEDFSDIIFLKNHKSFFMLEFDNGDNPEEFQEELMVLVGFDRNFHLTNEVIEESIWR